MGLKPTPEVIKMKTLKHRVIAMMDREELEFLDKLGKDALFSTGHKLSYNEIITALVDFSMDIGLCGNKVKSGGVLKERILQQALEKSEKSKDSLNKGEVER